MVGKSIQVLATALVCVSSLTVTAPTSGPGNTTQATVALWLESSLQRVFPNSPPGAKTTLKLLAARNQRLSFQACVRNQGKQQLRVRCSVIGEPDLPVQVRRVGYVPMPHHTTDVDEAEQDGMGYVPGLVPDPLFAEQAASVGPWENQSFWITGTVPSDIEPGPRNLTVRLTVETGKEQIALREMIANVEVRQLRLQRRRGLPVTHWWRAESIYDWYKIEPFGEKWWQLTESYLKNLVSHGNNVIYVPSFQLTKEISQQPAQLVKVKTPAVGRYEFDFSDVRRFVELAERCGAEYFEWNHLWLYWGVKNPIHVYHRDGDRWALLWPTETEATTGTFRTFLEQFLPAFHQFLTAENLLDRSFFHLSDEPHGDEHFDNYRKARALLKELAPWMKVMDALSEVRYGKMGLTDIPIPLINAAQGYIDAGIPHWVYFCTVPRGSYLNRFFDTPLAKIRMSGWLFYRLKAQGFLHWGYNYWHKIESVELVDPFTEGASAAWPSIPYGDPFVVYPGNDGPIDSIRWEVFAESLQDYALLQTADIPPDDPLLFPIKSYADFPKGEQWIQNTLEQVLRGK